MGSSSRDLEKVLSQLEALTEEVAHLAVEQRKVEAAVLGVRRGLEHMDVAAGHGELVVCKAAVGLDPLCLTPRSGDNSEPLRDLGRLSSPGTADAAPSAASSSIVRVSFKALVEEPTALDVAGEEPPSAGAHTLATQRSFNFADLDNDSVASTPTVIKPETPTDIRLRYLLDKAEHKQEQEKEQAVLPSGQRRRSSVTLRVGLRKAPVLSRDQLITMIDTGMAVVICANAVVLGISCDNEPEWRGWSLIDMCFSFVFMAEVTVKLFLLGLKTFFGSPGNYFDVVVVLLDVGQVCLTLAGTSPGGGEGSLSASIFRLLRLLRLGRIIRVFRVSFFKEMLVMINGMMGGMNTLGWSLVLIVMPVYTVALAMRESLGRRSQADDDIASYFSTVPRSMFTVFRCTFGDCTTASGAALFEHVAQEFGWYFAIVYSFFTFVVTIGLFNVISAIFVENVISASINNELSQKHKRLLDEDLLASRVSILTQCILTKVDPKARTARLSDCMDTIKNVEVSREVFNDVICDPYAAAALRDLDICKEDHHNLFDILDRDKSGGLLFEEILLGIEKLRGDPRRSDIVGVDLMLRYALSRIEDLGRSLEDVQKFTSRAFASQA